MTGYRITLEQLLDGIRSGRLTEATASYWLQGRATEVRAARRPGTPPASQRKGTAYVDADDEFARLFPPSSAAEAERRAEARDRAAGAAISDDELYGRLFGDD